MASKVAVKIPKMQVLRAKGKKIKDTLNMLIRVLEKSTRYFGCFLDHIIWLACQVIYFPLSLFIFLSLFLFRFVSFSSFKYDLG